MGIYARQRNWFIDGQVPGWRTPLALLGMALYTVTMARRGGRKHRFGVASWVYGEELEQRSAMWWSPDSTMLAFWM